MPPALDAETDFGLLSQPMGASQATPGPDERIVDAAVRCLARFGLSKTTIEDIAREAGVGRATVYRAFPGGRESLLDAVFTAEVARYFVELDRALCAADSFEDLLVAAVGHSLRFLSEHPALRTIVALEPGVLLPQFSFQHLEPVLAVVDAFARPHLEPHVGDDASALAEHLVRVVLSYTLHPSDDVDPTDPASVRALVQDHVLAGLRSPAAR